MAEKTKQPDVYHSTAAYFDLRLGRRPSSTPEHLTKILYIPRHNNETAHLPIYEATEPYHRATGDAPLGSSLYITQLGMMKRPRGDNIHDNVAYLADIEARSKGDLQISMRKRALGSEACEVKLTMSPSCDVDSPALIETDNAIFKMDASFPTPPPTQNNVIITCPYFTITNTKGGASKPLQLQWQIDPVSDGPLRYTLVQRSEESPGIIRAIYHHLGWGSSLSLAYSEGVVLLTRDEAMEPIFVVSLLGMLAQLRKPDSRNRLERTGSKIVHAAVGLHRLRKWLIR